MVFGRVLEGFEVVTSVAQAPTFKPKVAALPAPGWRMQPELWPASCVVLWEASCTARLHMVWPGVVWPGVLLVVHL